MQTIWCICEFCGVSFRLQDSPHVDECPVCGFLFSLSSGDCETQAVVRLSGAVKRLQAACILDYLLDN